MSTTKVNYPYLPEGEIIHYVASSDRFMRAAKQYAKTHSMDKEVPTGSVIVLEGEIIGKGANGSDFHDKYGCERVRRGIPTGERYDLCEGCHPKNHSEPRAIEDALHRHTKKELSKAALYLWGHWWACEPCWNAIKAAGIKTVYLMDGSHELYNKQHPRNIIGKQFV
nr:Cytidine and deoxycytidylate deaminase zinc-binding region [uncultured bacterium]